MYHTQDIDALGEALIDLMSFFASPQRDEALLREARVDLDRALFPILVRLSLGGSLSVAALATQVGRDHTTVSRQLAKLDSLGLIARATAGLDRRVRTAELTGSGEKIVHAITAARRRLLSQVLAVWTEADMSKLAVLNRRFVQALKTADGDGG